MLPIPIFYKSLTVSSVFTVLSPCNNIFAWDSWGVRDIAILTDRDGFHHKDGDSMVFYYTGSTSRGKLQQTGRAISRDSGKTWQRNPCTPVLRTSPGANGMKMSLLLRGLLKMEIIIICITVDLLMPVLMMQLAWQ